MVYINSIEWAIAIKINFVAWQLWWCWYCKVLASIWSEMWDQYSRGVISYLT